VRAEVGGSTSGYHNTQTLNVLASYMPPSDAAYAGIRTASAATIIIHRVIAWPPSHPILAVGYARIRRGYAAPVLAIVTRSIARRAAGGGGTAIAACSSMMPFRPN
jgi:hypothetical protein